MNGLFIVGNKRSGSTHLMHLLNLHNEVFVSNESDIIWILYNFHNKKEIEPYPYGSPAGMNQSMEIAGHLLDKNASVRENFEKYQRYLMEKGFLSEKGSHKKSLKYIGDQKPYQNIDPTMMPFIMENFPNAKFIHLVRHPFEVVQSSMKFANGTGGFIWKDMSPEQILEKWEMHENWVKDARKKYDLDIIDLRYDRLISTPKKEMARIFKFLGVNFDSDLLNNCKEITKPNFKPITTYNLTESQKKLLKEYNMKTSFSWLDLKVFPKISRYYYRAFKNR